MNKKILLRLVLVYTLVIASRVPFVVRLVRDYYNRGSLLLLLSGIFLFSSLSRMRIMCLVVVEFLVFFSFLFYSIAFGHSRCCWPPGSFAAVATFGFPDE